MSGDPPLPATAIDLGATGTVVAVRDPHPAFDDDALAHAWAEAWALLDRPGPRGVGALALDDAVAGDPVTGAEAWRAVIDRPPLGRYGLRVTTQDAQRPPSTRSLPDRRDRIVVAAGTAVGGIGLRTDAAVAVAGHHLLRRLGADPALGAEALRRRARAPDGRRIWEDHDGWRGAAEWHENWLVIDVGAATTTCARVRVVLVAGRDGADGPAARVVLRVAAAGAPADLGGDQLTLAVFRHLADELGVGAATRFAVGPAWDRPARARNFARLWAAAEHVTRLGLVDEAPADVTVRIGPAEGERTTVTTTVTMTGPEVLVPGLEGDTPAGTVATVTAGRLAELAAPLVDGIAALATGIARAGAPLPADRELDVVVFSGGTLLAGHLRCALEARLRIAAEREGLGPAFEVAFDRAHARTAPALGALFLSTSAGDDEADGPVIDGSELHDTLAADFETTVASLPVEVFRRGERLVDRGGGRRTARSPFLPVQQRVVLHRVDYRHGRSRVGSVWGRYEVDAELLGACHAAGIRMAFEIDQHERVTLLLRRGPGPAALDLSDGRAFADPVPSLVAEGRLTADLYDRAVDPRRDPSCHPAALRAGQPVGRGLVYRVEQSQVWTSVGGPDRHSLLVMPPGRPWLSIDAAGVARHHADEPRELIVASIDDLVTAPDGAGLRTVLRVPEDPDPDRDPFSGHH